MRVPTLLAYVTLMTLTIHVARADEPPPANASGSPSDEAPADTPVDHSQERSERQSNRDTASETEKPLRGPKYLNLRYDEDFSYLDGEEGTYEPDFWDPIKNIHLDEDWRLSIGGEFAFRLEAMTNTAFDERDRTQDTYGLFRYFLHADLKYKDIFRVFVQAIVAHDEEHQFGRRAFDENIGDLHQLFVDVRPFGEGSPLLVRLGRQELQYGDQRFIAPLDWANTRRRFDAAKLILEGEDWQFDFFYAKPIPVRPVEFDRYDEEFDLYGAYFSYKGIPRHTLDLFLFAVDDTRNRTNPNGNSGDVTRITVGSRLFGRTAGFDYTGVISGQWGNWAGDTIQAWAATLDGGYTFEEHAWKPRIGAGFDYASGDRDPNDGRVGTYDQLFQLGHKYLGYIDVVGRQNVIAANANITFWPWPKKLRFAMAYHAFWLAQERDALYNLGGGVTRRDVTGESGREVGQELDVTLLWNVDRHSSVLFGYSHFWDSQFITNTGKSEDPDFFYVWYKYRF